MTNPDPIELILPAEPLESGAVMTVTDGENAGMGFVRENAGGPGSQSWLLAGSPSGQRMTYFDVWGIITQRGSTRMAVSYPTSVDPYPFPWVVGVEGDIIDATGVQVPSAAIVTRANQLAEEGVLP